ncbi:MAG: TlpA disulfide reductase family protein [Rikenellaceae bacterium]
MVKKVKQIVLIAALMLFVNGVWAQRLIYNKHIPHIEIESIIKGKPIEKGKAIYIDFFILNSDQNSRELAALESFAARYSDKVNFVLIVKDNKEDVESFFKEKPVSYSIYYDLEGSTFSSFGVKFVPLSVLSDKKGNFIWQGKSSSLSDEIIRMAF